MNQLQGMLANATINKEQGTFPFKTKLLISELKNKNDAFST